MLYGKCFSAAFGSTAPQILQIKASSFGGGIRAIVYVRPQYRERYYIVCINATFINTFWCDSSGQMELVLPPNYGNTISSFWIEDCGRQSGFSEDTLPYVTWQARYQDSLTANRLGYQWSVEGQYKYSTVQGDSQLSSIVITGAKRGVNVEDVPEYPTRGRIYYSLLYIAGGMGTYILRWWNGNKLIAEGTRSGNGAISCAQIDNSGVSVTASITYTGDVKLYSAWLDLKWPKTYQIHYSTSSLSFPRSPEATVSDNGVDDYSYISTTLASGTYNTAIVAVDDEGDQESAPTVIPTYSPVVISNGPAAPTITAVTGSAAAGLTVAFTNGETGCTYKGYYSLKNSPINFGNYSAGPTPIGPTAANATSLATAAIADVAAVDNTSNYTTCQSAFDSAVSTCNTAFAVGAVGFVAAFQTCEASILSAVNTLGTALGLSLNDMKEQIIAYEDNVEAYLNYVGTGTLSATEWATQAGIYYGNWLKFLGTTLQDNPARYSLPNGALAGSLSGGNTTPTSGTQITGTGEAADNSQRTNQSLYQLSQPFVKAAKFYIVVRATKASVEEQNGSVWEVELDAAGAIVAARPAKATIVSIATSGLSLTVTGGYISDNAAGTAATLDLYVIAAASTLNPSSPDQNAGLSGSEVNGFQSVTFPAHTVGASGWYKVYILARTAGNVRSALYDERYIYLSTDTPNAVTLAKVYAVRSKGR